MVSISRHHLEWLSLLEISGPFLSLPVLNEAFPQGLDAHDPDLFQDLRAAREEWLDNQMGLKPDPDIHQAWIDYVLTRVLGFQDNLLLRGDEIPERFTAKIEDRLIQIKPDLILRKPGIDEPEPVLAIQTYPQDQALDKAPKWDSSQESIQTRMMLLLHAIDIPLGLVTNGRAWMLVVAPQGETTSFITWYSHLWLDEPLTLRAFRSLLSLQRFFGVPEDQTLVSMLQDSADKQQDVTTQLGYQVRSAIETLIRSLDEADRDRGRVLLRTVSESVLFEAALTVMMRLVFMLSAEERKLFPLDDPFFAQNYAVSTLRGQLREKADQFGEDVLDFQYDAWSRLLAAFRMVYAGANHDRLRQPAYGGSLFDPDRFPFLEGRGPGTKWEETPANPLPINNKTILHILDALQSLLLDIPGGGKQAQQLSFRALDIEQIGHVYESLLDHQLRRAVGVVVGLAGAKNKEPEVPLNELEKRYFEEDDLLDYLEENTGRSRSALKNDLHRETDMYELNRLRVACENDEVLVERIQPYFSLIRQDDFGRIMVIQDGSFYLTEGHTRRSTGTHYTPRILTEPIVQHTLDPQVYYGPAEGLPREEWILAPPEKLLNLKICDMAMGSGAFLVQVVRYLGDRVVESWARFAPIEPKGPDSVDYDIFGNITDTPGKMLPRDTEERQTLARRLVAERCIYGVDKNPLAVEMAKLSLWLVTLAKGRPFGFLDHALKCGDSLVGTDAETFRRWARDISGSTTSLFDQELTDALKEAEERRRELEAFEVRDIRDVALKEELYQQAEKAVETVRIGADILTGLDLMDLTESDRQRLRGELLIAYIKGEVDTPQALLAREKADAEKVLHWFLEFPEVFQQGGFNSFIGNPPFMGGQRISGEFGDNYLRYLNIEWNHSTGSTDLCAFFFLQAYRLLRINGTFGFLATNTIAQGFTRERGLAFITTNQGVIYRAVNNLKWPGEAAVIVDVVHISKGRYYSFDLDGKAVPFISSLLDSMQDLGEPYKLISNEGLSFQGSIVLGMGFILTPKQAYELLESNPKNLNIIVPYLNGYDVNNRVDHSPSRWVINFKDWPLEQANQYTECMEIIKREIYPKRMKYEKINSWNEHVREYWWQFGAWRQNLYDSIKDKDRALVRTRVTKTHAFAFLPTDIVHSEAVVVFADSRYSFFAVLQSTFHEIWAWKYGSTLKQDLRYSPTDIFENFPFPENYETLETIGENYYCLRELVMKNFQIGFTELYNSFHDPIQKNADFEKLRTTHIEMDCEILRLFGWVDIELGYDFHKTDLGTRFTISDDARREVLTRLLQLNHQRYEEEVLAGLHGEKERKNWIREHGESYMGSQQHGQLSLIDDAPSQGTLLYETKDKAAGERKPEYYRCWKCGRLLTAEDRDAHTREVHGGEDPGYAGVG